MILLQNPSVPTPTNPVEIDAAILDIKSELETGLIWLTNGYGRAYKNLDITNGERVYFPEIYLGKQSGSFRYTNISPDNDKTGQCFFFVRRETITEYQQGMFNFLNYDVSLIFSVNMELINSTLIETEIYQQNLVAQVRNVLTRQILGKFYQLTINNIEYLFEDVFRDFNLSEQSTIEKSPLSHFRLNLSVVLPEICPVPPVEVGGNPCTQPNTFSMLFDGVSESVSTKIQAAAYDLERTDLFSFSIWIKPTTLVEAHIINKFVVVGGLGKGYFIRTTTTGQIRFVLANDTGTGNSIDIITPTGLINSGVWQNVIVTYDGSSTAAGCKIYINSILQPNTVSVDNLTSSILQPLVLLNFGGGNSRFFNGNIDEVLAYNIALTQSNVNDIYANGTPPKDPLLSSSLFVHCRMGEGSLFGINNRHFPDSTNNTTSYISVNMEELDMVTDVP